MSFGSKGLLNFNLAFKSCLLHDRIRWDTKLMSWNGLLFDEVKMTRLEQNEFYDQIRFKWTAARLLVRRRVIDASEHAAFRIRLFGLFWRWACVCRFEWTLDNRWPEPSEDSVDRFLIIFYLFLTDLYRILIHLVVEKILRPVQLSNASDGYNITCSWVNEWVVA